MTTIIEAAKKLANTFLGKYGSIPAGTSYKFKYQLVAIEVRRLKSEEGSGQICAIYKSANPPEINIASDPTQIKYPFSPKDDVGFFPKDSNGFDILPFTDINQISSTTGDQGQYVAVDFQQKL